MKKNKKIIIIVISIVLILLVIGVAVYFGVVNRSKEAASVVDFETILKDEGFVVINADYQASEYDYIKNMYIARKSNDGYEIDFYEFDNQENAEKYYNDSISIFTSSIEGDFTPKIKKGKNFIKYSLVFDGEYIEISRIDNTVVYLKVDETYKNDVDSVLRKLGY